jgi:hypothetical protein
MNMGVLMDLSSIARAFSCSDDWVPSSVAVHPKPAAQTESDIDNSGICQRMALFCALVNVYNSPEPTRYLGVERRQNGDWSSRWYQTPLEKNHAQTEIRSQSEVDGDLSHKRWWVLAYTKPRSPT